jgi:hypothetical protein
MQLSRALSIIPSFEEHCEAQSLGDVLPFIRAHRPKLPHPVYDILNYRMRNIGRFIG